MKALEKEKKQNGGRKEWTKTGEWAKKKKKKTPEKEKKKKKYL